MPDNVLDTVDQRVDAIYDQLDSLAVDSSISHADCREILESIRDRIDLSITQLSHKE